MTSAISSMLFGSSESLENQMKKIITESMKELNQSVERLSDTVREQTATMNVQTATIANLEGRVKAQTREIASLKSQLSIQAKKAEISDLKIQNLVSSGFLERIFYSWERLMKQDNVQNAEAALKNLENEAKLKLEALLEKDQSDLKFKIEIQPSIEFHLSSAATSATATLVQADRHSDRKDEKQVEAQDFETDALLVDKSQILDGLTSTGGDGVQLTGLIK